MTAIAYRDGILAVDGQTSWGNIKTKSGSKIKPLEIPGFGRCLVALSGTVHGVENLFNFLKTSCDGADRPFEGMETASRYGIVVDYKLRVYPVFGNGYIGEQDHNPIVAEGSAFEFLMGAMCAGASAEEAVRLACEHCNYCGGEVEVMNVRSWHIDVVRNSWGY